MRKQKLFNQGNSVPFIDNEYQGKSKRKQESKYSRTEYWTFKRGLTTKLHLCCTASCPVVFRLSPGNSHDAPEGRKLIQSIYPKNNNYLLIDRAYEDDKTLALAKDHGFNTVVPPKKKS